MRAPRRRPRGPRPTGQQLPGTAARPSGVQHRPTWRDLRAGRGADGLARARRRGRSRSRASGYRRPACPGRAARRASPRRPSARPRGRGAAAGHARRLRAAPSRLRARRSRHRSRRRPPTGRRARPRGTGRAAAEWRADHTRPTTRSRRGRPPRRTPVSPWSCPRRPRRRRKEARRVPPRRRRTPCAVGRAARRARGARRSSRIPRSPSSDPDAPVGSAQSRSPSERRRKRATIGRASEAKERGDGHRRGEPEPRSRDRRGREGVRPLLVVGAGPDQPDRGRRRRGPSLLGLRREAVPRLRLAARQRQHRPPAPEDHPGDQGPGRPALHDRPADGERVALAARPDARGGDARRPVRLVLHERRRGGERERRQARAPRHRPQQGHRAVPLVPRRDERRGHADRRPAPLGGRARDARGREDVRPLHVPLPRRSPGSVPRLHRRAAPRGDPRVRGRAHRRGGDSRDGHRHQRDHPAARRLPAGDSRGLRPARDPADPRRGDGGLRADGHAGSPASTGTSCRTSSPWRRASTRATSRSGR